VDRGQALVAQAQDLARGKVPVPALAAVTAYADWLRFGVLPYAGGTFDQPAGLMDEFRRVHVEYTLEETKLTNRAERRARRKQRTRR